MPLFEVYFHFLNGVEFMDSEIEFKILLPFVPEKRQVFHIDCSMYESLEIKLNESKDDYLKNRYEDYKYKNGFSFDDCIYIDCICVKVDELGNYQIHCELASDKHPMKLLVKKS